MRKLEQIVVTKQQHTALSAVLKDLAQEMYSGRILTQRGIEWARGAFPYQSAGYGAPLGEKIMLECSVFDGNPPPTFIGDNQSLRFREGIDNSIVSQEYFDERMEEILPILQARDFHALGGWISDVTYEAYRVGLTQFPPDYGIAIHYEWIEEQYSYDETLDAIYSLLSAFCFYETGNPFSTLFAELFTWSPIVVGPDFCADKYRQMINEVTHGRLAKEILG